MLADIFNDVDQFFRVEKGEGKAIINDVEHDIADGSVVIIPAGTKHNIVNGDSEEMKLYTLYTPPHHQDGTIHKTKDEAEADEEHFDGETTE